MPLHMLCPLAFAHAVPSAPTYVVFTLYVSLPLSLFPLLVSELLGMVTGKLFLLFTASALQKAALPNKGVFSFLFCSIHQACSFTLRYIKSTLKAQPQCPPLHKSVSDSGWSNRLSLKACSTLPSPLEWYLLLYILG